MLWGAVKWKPNTRHKTHSLQKLATLVTYRYCHLESRRHASENAQVNSCFFISLEVCSSRIENGGKQRRAERRGSFVGGWGCWNAIKSKRLRMLSDEIILLHDNARPHTVNVVRDNIQRFGWDILQHPPYIPDLSPCDLHIFATWRKTFVDVGFIRTRKCKSGWGYGSISGLPLSTRLELTVSSLSGINVLTIMAITFE